MIRRCRIDDATVIQEINKYQLGYDYPVTKTVDNLKRLLEDKNHHFIFVFENENTKKVEGYIHAELFEETYFDPMLNVLALAVSSFSQGKGIGSQLMFRIENEAENLNIKEIRLNSGESRNSAHKFYEKIGYTCSKKQKRFGKKLI